MNNNVKLRIAVSGKENVDEDTSISVYTNSRSSVSYLVSRNSKLAMSYSQSQLPIELISIQGSSVHKISVTDSCNIIQES
ncbi:hypothetical protein [Vibrio marisflavi]|nr:hypothetical protein [Vibrio marisflavi]